MEQKDSVNQPILSLIYPRLAQFALLFSFGLILFFLPLEFPGLVFETALTFSHWIEGPRKIFYNLNLYGYPSDLMIIVLSLCTIHKWKTLFKSDSSRYLASFLFVAAMSLYHASSVSPAGTYKIFALCTLFCVFHLVSYILEGNAVQKMHLFFSVILIMMAFEGAIGLTQYFTQTHVGLKIFEPFPLSITQFPMPSGELWLIDSIMGIKRSIVEVSRPYGTLTHANTFGGFCFFCSFISFYFFYYAKTLAKEIIFGIFIFLHFFVLCLSFSRAALFAYLLMTTFWFILFFWKISRSNDDTRKLLRLLIYVGTSVLICFTLLYPQFTERGGVVNYNDFVATSGDLLRIQSARVAWTMILQNLVFGVGLENYANHIAEIVMSLGSTYNPAQVVVHNIYMLITAETGIFGGILFILFIYSILKKGLKDLTPLTLTIATTFIGFLLLGCIDFYLWRAPPMRLAFFLTASFLYALSEQKAMDPAYQLNSQHVLLRSGITSNLSTG